MTFKGLVKLIIALVIIGAGAAIGWAVATSTNPYAPGAETATPVAAAQPNNAANRPTAIPTFTAASGANTTPGAATGAGTNQGAAGAATGANGGAAGQGQRTAPVTGTVSTYNASNKILTVKDATGKNQEFNADSARVTKTSKVSSDDFSKSLSANGIVLLTGEKGSDGTYTAAALVAVDTAGFGGGNGAAPGGAGAVGTRGAGANGTPGTGAGANTTPGARGGNFGGGNGGGFAGGAGGFGGAGGAVIIRGGTLQGNKFTGTSATGETITATISDSTALEKQSAGTLDDLKPGMNVSVTSRAATTDAPPQAIAITLT